ncbi:MULTISPECIES: PEP-CTERM sorting domain-containing protein [unclassified Lentimonas]|uniref:PEP-CTERM sorting domain-containing protein n=1 Tax=unclassified Lentimonas TaxID=2630993 RepID=UPI0013281036|nr:MULTISPECIES: PEP-CTERM sorting domain-containing protein [unclassified Lentimonas]CAA6692891.1 Unannotated [Lentimonas sp. CC19]CAA6695769.1 Unannotated [Lentimonas sp. CC10]CAA7069600.1 Unannotated [Lentimonas sp. CC11]
MRKFTAILAILAAFSSLNAFDIHVNYDYDTNGFFDLSKKAVIDQVVSDVESRLSYSATDVIPGGTNTWTWRFEDPSSSGADISIFNPLYTGGSFNLYVGAKSQGSSTLGFGGNVGLSGSGNSAFISNILDKNSATQYDPYAGFLSMNSDTSWYVNAAFDAGAASGLYDLYSVFAHELLHAMGFGLTGAQIWNNNQTNGVYSSANVSSKSLNANNDHWASGTESEYWDGSAWATQEAAMDPNISTGTRKYITELDYAVFSDYGFDVSSPVPEPSTYASLAGLLALFSVASKRRSIR